MTSSLKSYLPLLFFVPIIGLASCLNPCKDVKCENGGTCDDGTCICTDGFEGSDCTERSRDKFIGTYSLTESCNSGWTEYEMTIVPGNTDNTVIIQNLYNLSKEFNATISNDIITISEQSIDAATISGNGLYSSGNISISFSLRVYDHIDNCSIWGDKIR